MAAESAAVTAAAGEETTALAKANSTQTATVSPKSKVGQGAQFIYLAAAVSTIICTNLTDQQINLLGNFLSVVTSCIYAILTVENPTDIIAE